MIHSQKNGRQDAKKKGDDFENDFNEGDHKINELPRLERHGEDPNGNFQNLELRKQSQNSAQVFETGDNMLDPRLALQFSGGQKDFEKSNKLGDGLGLAEKCQDDPSESKFNFSNSHIELDLKRKGSLDLNQPLEKSQQDPVRKLAFLDDTYSLGKKKTNTRVGEKWKESESLGKASIRTFLHSTNSNHPTSDGVRLYSECSPSENKENVDPNSKISSRLSFTKDPTKKSKFSAIPLLNLDQIKISLTKEGATAQLDQAGVLSGLRSTERPLN